MINTNPYITCIPIGDELLSGITKDTNSNYFASVLSLEGYSLKNVNIIGDSINEIVRVINDAVVRSDIIIITGGLGPTPDDITREALAKVLNCKLKVFEKERLKIHEKLKIYSKKIKFVSEMEAYLPEFSIPINNSKGIAPGFRSKKGKATIFCIPGVPLEAKNMFIKSILPFIKRRYPIDKTIHYVLKTIGIGESDLYNRIKKFHKKYIPIGFYPKMREVELRIHIPFEHKTEGVKLYNSLKKELKNFIYAETSLSIEEVLSRILKEKEFTLATAESCTGGLIAKRITDIEGASSFFKGSIIAYSNDIKEKILGVKNETLMKYGAVSKIVAEEMAFGLQKLMNVNIAISVTGIAGPKGGSKIKPIGLVYIAIYINKKIYIKEFNFKGDREKIRWLSSQAAFHMLWEMIK